MMSKPISGEPGVLPGGRHAHRPSPMRRALRDASVRLGLGALILLLLLAIGAPWLYTMDPTAIDPAAANLAPLSHGEFMSLSGGDPIQRWFLFGTDSLGRDIWSRVLYGARISLMVGACVALLSLVLGLAVGVVSGYFRWIDGALMRVMDGMMAIPGILLAIALV
jgi:peptide/nickel transport system permease protein